MRLAIVPYLVACLVVGILAGAQLHRQHPQPCIITFDSGGYRYCRLDPQKGAWVK